MAANGIHFTRVGDMLLPVGFRFRPTEEELISYYLQMKLEGMDYVFSHVIREINICDHEPRDLPGLSPIDSDNKEWYFFSTYKKKGKNQTERATKEGFWKITGAQKPVKTQDKRTVIGKKRILTFHRGQVRNSQKTDWVMHEYYIPQTNPNDNQTDFVVCCVKKKSGENVDAANCENQQPLALMDIEEEHTQQQQSMDYFERAKCRMLATAPGNNDYHGLQSAYGADEPDDNFREFLNSVIVDGNQHETTHANIFNVSILPRSIVRVYFDDEAAERRAAVDFPPKKTSITKSNKEAEVAHGNNAKKGLKQSQNATTAGNWKDSFISWETSPPVTSPPSVYLFNMVVGVIMFCVFARAAVLYGQWC